jgi:hypothetical protein
MLTEILGGFVASSIFWGFLLLTRQKKRSFEYVSEKGNHYSRFEDINIPSISGPYIIKMGELSEKIEGEIIQEPKFKTNISIHEGYEWKIIPIFKPRYLGLDNISVYISKEFEKLHLLFTFTNDEIIDCTSLIEKYERMLSDRPLLSICESDSD